MAIDIETAARVAKLASRLLGAGVRLSGVWLQDWMGKRQTALGDRLWWNWILDDHATLGSYAAWDTMREALGPVRG